MKTMNPAPCGFRQFVDLIRIFSTPTASLPVAQKERAKQCTPGPLRCKGVVKRAAPPLLYDPRTLRLHQRSKMVLCKEDGNHRLTSRMISHGGVHNHVSLRCIKDATHALLSKSKTFHFFLGPSGSSRTVCNTYGVTHGGACPTVSLKQSLWIETVRCLLSTR